MSSQNRKYGAKTETETIKWRLKLTALSLYRNHLQSKSIDGFDLMVTLT